MRNHNSIRFVFFAIFLLLGSSIAQSQDFLLSGVVADKESLQRLSSVTITNTTQKKRVVTEVRGEFKISALQGDTLSFAILGYNTYYHIVKDSSFFQILMTRNSFMLDQVDVRGKTKEFEMADVMESYKRHGVYQGGKPSIVSYIFMPITSLYERFSSKGRQARRFANYVENETQALHIDRLFSRYRIQSLTELEGEDLNNFLIIYRPTFQQSQYWVEYDINAYIKESFEKFEKNGRPKAFRLPRIDSLTKF